MLEALEGWEPAWGSGRCTYIERGADGTLTILPSDPPEEGMVALVTVKGSTVSLLLSPPAAPWGVALELVEGFIGLAAGSGRAVDCILGAARLLRGLYGEGLALEVVAFEPGTPGGQDGLFVSVAAFRAGGSP